VAFRYERLFLVLAVAVASLLWATGAGAAVIVESWTTTTSLEGSWRYRVGDDPGWAVPDLEDRAWEETQVPDGEAPPQDTRGRDWVWYRLHVRVSAAARTERALEGARVGLALGWESATVERVFVDGREVGIHGEVEPTYGRGRRGPRCSRYRRVP
jgi:hypothetical protein